MSDWQPIETAPHGRKVLVAYRNSLSKWRIVLACYYEPNTLDASDVHDLDGFAPSGWYEECDSREDILPCNEEPTHWQPLPEPPK